MNIDTFINTVMTSGRPFAVRENRAQRAPAQGASPLLEI